MGPWRFGHKSAVPLLDAVSEPHGVAVISAAPACAPALLPLGQAGPKVSRNGASRNAPAFEESRLSLSMNPSVLPASCRQTDQRKELPARCRQHLGGAVSSSVGGSWSQCMRKSERSLSM